MVAERRFFVKAVLSSGFTGSSRVVFEELGAEDALRKAGLHRELSARRAELEEGGGSLSHDALKEDPHYARLAAALDGIRGEPTLRHVACPPDSPFVVGQVYAFIPKEVGPSAKPPPLQVPRLGRRRR